MAQPPSVSRRSFLKMVVASSVLSLTKSASATSLETIDAMLTKEPLEIEVTDNTLSFANYFSPPDRYEAYQLSFSDIETKEGLLAQAEYNQSLRERIYNYAQEVEYEPEVSDFDFEDVQPFLEQLSAEELQKIVLQIDAWFKEKPSDDWEMDVDNTEILVPLSGQNAAFRFFERDGVIGESDANEIAEALGIVIVEGDRPGSTYYAAELRIPVNDANKRAKELDLPVRFIAGSY